MNAMNINTAAIDEAVLALLYLTLHTITELGGASIGKYSIASMNEASLATQSIKRSP